MATVSNGIRFLMKTKDPAEIVQAILTEVKRRKGLSETAQVTAANRKKALHHAGATAALDSVCWFLELIEFENPEAPAPKKKVRRAKKVPEVDEDRLGHGLEAYGHEG